jgi:hypothetical protein
MGDWWFDESYYPGPVGSHKPATWAEITRAFGDAFHEIQFSISRGYGKSQIAKAFNQVSGGSLILHTTDGWDTFVEEVPKILESIKPKPLNFKLEDTTRQHGPRPGGFDRKGRKI